MELKWEKRLWLVAQWCVLIVPLWNWNAVIAAEPIAGSMRFNRTFMELKLMIPCSFESKVIFVLIVPLWNWNKVDTKTTVVENNCFNRTFMELKFVQMENVQIRLYQVLIVPLWNWNVTFADMFCLKLRFNRTFMELKS